MTILTSTMAALPRRFAEERAVSPPSSPTASATPPGAPGPTGGATAIYRLAVPPILATQPLLSSEKVEGLLRVISQKVAEQLGTPGRIANAMVWLSVDAKRLHDNWDDLRSDGVQRVIEVGRLAAGALGAAGTLPALPLAARAETSLYFLPAVGESFHRGEVTLTSADLADFAGADHAAWIRVNEVLGGK